MRLFLWSGFQHPASAVAPERYIGAAEGQAEHRSSRGAEACSSKVHSGLFRRAQPGAY